MKTKQTEDMNTNKKPERAGKKEIIYIFINRPKGEKYLNLSANTSNFGKKNMKKFKKLTQKIVDMLTEFESNL